AVVARAAEVVRAGGLIVYPTETLYAVGGAGLDPAAARRARLAKGRPDDKPLPLIVADADAARGLCRSWPAAAGSLAARYWPGPLTLVLPASPRVPIEVTAGTGTVAVRVSGLALARAISRAGGPLVSTSANRAGEPAATTCGAALLAVGSAIALALDGGACTGAPSTIVDLTGDRPALLREGAVAWAELTSLLG
ncbi:MAG: L-threonylcarbamoyladenylate synthase, partial [Vicinamibacteria bacterium]